MKKTTFDKLEADLIERGYNKYNQKWHHEDYVIGKGFNHGEYEYGRPAYQILLSVYDYTLPHDFSDRLPQQMKNYVAMEVHIDVSRTIDERVDIVLPWFNDTTIEEIEKAAEGFYKDVCLMWPEPRKEVSNE